MHKYEIHLKWSRKNVKKTSIIYSEINKSCFHSFSNSFFIFGVKYVIHMFGSSRFTVYIENANTHHVLVCIITWHVGNDGCFSWAFKKIMDCPWRTPAENDDLRARGGMLTNHNQDHITTTAFTAHQHTKSEQMFHILTHPRVINVKWKRIKKTEWMCFCGVEYMN